MKIVGFMSCNHGYPNKQRHHNEYTSSGTMAASTPNEAVIPRYLHYKATAAPLFVRLKADAKRVASQLCHQQEAADSDIYCWDKYLEMATTSSTAEYYACIEPKSAQDVLASIGSGHNFSPVTPGE
jgi:hypothetical protein